MKGGNLEDKFKKIAVVGADVRFSLSPVIHMAAYRAAGADLEYQAVCVQAGEMREFLHRQKSEGEFVALSVTAPLKRELFALGSLPFEGSPFGNLQERPLQEAGTSHEDERERLLQKCEPGRDWALDFAYFAYLTGVANTVLIEQGTSQKRDTGCPQGSKCDALRIFNTDVYGIGAALLHAGCSVEGRDVSILGAGATAMSSLVAAVLLGAKSVKVFARRVKKADLDIRTCLEKMMKLGTVAFRDEPFAKRVDLRTSLAGVEVLPIEDFGKAGEAHLLVDSIPGGYRGEGACTFEYFLPLDYVWGIFGKMNFSKKKCGNFIDGKEVLFWQGFSQVKLFLDEYANIDLDTDIKGDVLCAMRQALFER